MRQNLQTYLFLTGLFISFCVLYSFPSLTEEQKGNLLRYPRSVEDLRLIHDVVLTYSQSHFYHVLAAYLSIYINFQSFGIPGTAFLAILSGPIFGGFWQGFFTSHCCSVAGASICFYVSKSLGSNFVQQRFPSKLNWLRKQVDENRHNLFYYYLFLRFTPLVPNFFINLSSSVVGVPYLTFLSASVVGLIPYTYILVESGMQLDQMTSLGGYDPKKLGAYLALGFIALLPTFMTRKPDGLKKSE